MEVWGKWENWDWTLKSHTMHEICFGEGGKNCGLATQSPCRQEKIGLPAAGLMDWRWQFSGLASAAVCGIEAISISILVSACWAETWMKIGKADEDELGAFRTHQSYHCDHAQLSKDMPP
jgi:hypothetical protein